MTTGFPPPGDEHAVLALERAALARWCRGDPSGFLELSDDDVGYFDPFRPRRIDGIVELTAYYEQLRGTINAVAWEVLEPRVVEIDDVAILTFCFRSWGASGAMVVWNCTEVYRRRPAGWRIAQTHWSFAAADTPS